MELEMAEKLAKRTPTFPPSIPQVEIKLARIQLWGRPGT
jgi:hypothetical protein